MFFLACGGYVILNILIRTIFNHPLTGVYEMTGLFAVVFASCSLVIRIDEAGNVIGRLDGRDESLPAVMAGSHIDSIRDGGNFDGMAGVVAGLEAARIFRDTGLRPKRSIEIVGFTGEENSRFYPGQFGSRAMAGMDRLRAGRQGRGGALRESPALRRAGLRYGPPTSQNALLFGMFL